MISRRVSIFLRPTTVETPRPRGSGARRRGDEENGCPATPRAAARRRAGDAARTRRRLGLRPRRVVRAFRARARARGSRRGSRPRGGKGEMTRDAPGSRTALGPSRRASSPRRWREGTCRRRRRRRRRGDRRSGRRLRRGDRRSGRRLPAGHRTRLCRSPRLGSRHSPGRRHFVSRRRGQRLGPTRGRSPSRCRRRRAGEGEDKACEVGVAPRCVRNRCVMRKGGLSRARSGA